MTGLWVTVPLAAFRVPQAREYAETYPCPPPSTVYGFLLALVGEANRLVHQGAELAVALLAPPPPPSTVVRIRWRIKRRDQDPGVGANRRPDFQDVLTGLTLGIWVRPGRREASQPPLADRVAQALTQPAAVRRWGALALGESTHLVDIVRPWRATDPPEGWGLVQDPRGPWTLPVWPDHVGAATTWGTYRLERGPLPPQDPAWWSAIHPQGPRRD